MSGKETWRLNDREPPAAAKTPPLEHIASVAGTHPLHKAMLTASWDTLGLVGALRH